MNTVLESFKKRMVAIHNEKKKSWKRMILIHLYKK